ncbi:hypothetical protein N8J89_07740 [Crossiella sp. CA-258035]|uniref:hypothetical protein n=1 Tax=Crossiella sp. CA-258035 TaxID=2981138 RepID=UPI0024BCA601|nr:hypothetical protein [Crossiella sp. CA-258035]WHT20945.1 hypothetical protein N8J89_07740 [Crossiella sp. CA-258035]
MERRKEELGLSWPEIASRGGTTRETLLQARNGSSRLRSSTRRAIELGLSWAAGSVARILEGGQPTTMDEPVPRAAIESGDLSPQQVVKVLSALADLGDASLFWETYRTLYARVHGTALDESQDQIN